MEALEAVLRSKTLQQVERLERRVIRLGLEIGTLSFFSSYSLMYIHFLSPVMSLAILLLL